MLVRNKKFVVKTDSEMKRMLNWSLSVAVLFCFTNVLFPCRRQNVTEKQKTEVRWRRSSDDRRRPGQFLLRRDTGRDGNNVGGNYDIWPSLSCFSHVAFSDATNFPISSSDEGISQYTSIVDVWNGEDAFDTKSVEAVGKHHDVSVKVVTSNTRYMSNCSVIFDSRWRKKKITRMTKMNR